MYYDKNYFRWQSGIGNFGGKANLFKFSKYIKPTDNVIDFGCGGGYLLQNVVCKNKMGIEVNDTARKIALKNNLNVVKNIDGAKNYWADLVISNHVLEHIEDPVETLKLLSKKVKKNGMLVFVVPHEIRNAYKSNDINQHLFTWSPMCLGNLFTKSGYRVVDCYSICHLWPPYFQTIRYVLGEKLFNTICWLYCKINNSLYQTCVVAVKD